MIYLLLLRVPSWPALPARSDTFPDIGIHVLCHELTVLRRQNPWDAENPVKGLTWALRSRVGVKQTAGIWVQRVRF
jgi:hypothetical protein